MLRITPEHGTFRVARQVTFDARRRFPRTAGGLLLGDDLGTGRRVHRAFDPVGRSGCRAGRRYKIFGTGSASIGGSAACAEPWRPSIKATWCRANSGTSFQLTPAEVTSGPPSGRMVTGLSLDIKNLLRVTEEGEHSCDPVCCRSAASPSGSHLARARRLARA